METCNIWSGTAAAATDVLINTATHAPPHGGKGRSDLKATSKDHQGLNLFSHTRSSANEVVFNCSLSDLASFASLLTKLVLSFKPFARVGSGRAGCDVITVGRWRLRIVRRHPTFWVRRAATQSHADQDRFKKGKRWNRQTSCSCPQQKRTWRGEEKSAGNRVLVETSATDIFCLERGSDSQRACAPVANS